MAVEERWPLWRGSGCREVETRVNVWTVHQKRGCREVAVEERWLLKRGGHCGEVAVVERLKQEWMYGLSAKKQVRSREVAVSGGSTALVKSQITLFFVTQTCLLSSI